ncbi:hypothetical protein AKO1_014923 [Acrasis kona]|uniref:Uncharacterized protein n=1 Tax=Acrasis kona TaxID=1008807 RepID=A0AAW2Z1Z2_9EUKA
MRTQHLKRFVIRFYKKIKMSVEVEHPHILKNEPITRFFEVVFDFGLSQAITTTKISKSPLKRDTFVQHGCIPTLASRNIDWSKEYTKKVKDTHFTDHDDSLQSKNIFPVRRDTEAGATEFLIHFTKDDPDTSGKVLSTTETFASMIEMQNYLFFSNHMKKNYLWELAVIDTIKSIQTTHDIFGQEIILTTSKSIINNSIPYEHCSLRCGVEFDPLSFLNEELGIVVCDHPIIHFMKEREKEKQIPDAKDYIDYSEVNEDDLEDYFFKNRSKKQE